MTARISRPAIQTSSPGKPADYFPPGDADGAVTGAERINSVTVFWLDTDLVRERLSAVVARMTDDPNVLRVVLFGSFAERRAVPGSDLDIMIVLAHDERPFLERVSAYLAYFSGIGIGVDLFPYTVSKLGNPLARRAAETGTVLFSR